MKPTVVSFDALHRFTAEAFRRTGVSEADAITGADVLVTTDAWGVFTHGTKCLAGYLRRLKAGGLRPKGTPHIVAEGGARATVDALSRPRYRFDIHKGQTFVTSKSVDSSVDISRAMLVLPTVHEFPNIATVYRRKNSSVWWAAYFDCEGKRH